MGHCGSHRNLGLGPIYMRLCKLTPVLFNGTQLEIPIRRHTHACDIHADQYTRSFLLFSANQECITKRQINFIRIVYIMLMVKANFCSII